MDLKDWQEAVEKNRKRLGNLNSAIDFDQIETEVQSFLEKILKDSPTAVENDEIIDFLSNPKYREYGDVHKNYVFLMFGMYAKQKGYDVAYLCGLVKEGIL